MHGFRGANPKQMQRMMKQLGVSVEDIEDVEEVIIKTQSKEYLFKNPSVTMMITQGQKTFQVIGEPEITESGVSEADIDLISSQTNVSKEAAKKALEECDGNIAEAILKLQSEK